VTAPSHAELSFEALIIKHGCDHQIVLTLQLTSRQFIWIHAMKHMESCSISK